MSVPTATWSRLKIPGLLVFLVYAAVVFGVWFLNRQLLQTQRESALVEARQLAVGQARIMREDFQKFREEFAFSLTKLGYASLVESRSPSPVEILPVRRFLALNQPLLQSLLLVSPEGEAKELAFEKAGYFSIVEVEAERAGKQLRQSKGAVRGQVFDLEGRVLCEVLATLNFEGFLKGHLLRFQATHPRHSIHAMYLREGEVSLVGSRRGGEAVFSADLQEQLVEDLREGFAGTLVHEALSDGVLSTFLTVYSPLTLADHPILLLVSVEERWIFSSLQKSWRIIFWATVLLLVLLALFFGIFFRRLLLDQREQERALASLEQSQERLLQTQSELQSANKDLLAAILRAEEAAAAAQQANKAKSDFLAVMSHEIRTPLNGLLGFTELLMDSPLPGESKSYVKTIQASGETLLHLLNDLLDFSKIESGKMELQSVPVELPELVGDTAGMIRSSAVQKKLDLQVEVEAGMPRWVSGDPGRLRQVLLNLLNNAIKFTERGFVRLKASKSGSGGDILFVVEDSGCGVPPARQAAIFEPFIQVDTGASRARGGSGLGLAICRQLVELMGGRLWLESKEGEGSSFYLSIPLPEVGGEEGVSPPPTSEVCDREKLDLGHLRILVAEDNPTNQKLVLLHLKKLGIKPQLAADGVAAVAAADREKFDCILMDFQMPHMDGVEATRQIRENEKKTGQCPTKIIAITANITEEAGQKAREAGMDGYLTKPFTATKLRGILVSLAEGSFDSYWS